MSPPPPGVVSMAGRVYAVGGFNSSLRERTVDVYDGARDQWSVAASMQERRSTLGAAVRGDLLYAVGGFNGSIGTCDPEPEMHQVLKRKETRNLPDIFSPFFSSSLLCSSAC